MRKLTAGLAAAALVMATGFASAQTAQQKPSDPGMTNQPQAGTSGTNPSDPKSIGKAGTTSGSAMKKDGMAKDGMAKDGMSKDGMSKDGMKK
jgi:pentapeptide MXKDX repeat protein